MLTGAISAPFSGLTEKQIFNPRRLLMKKTVLILLVSFLPFHSIQAQAPTTLEEYTFVIVGYKLQLNMKLEMKKGYSLKDLDSYVEEDRKVEFKALTRDGEKAPCAIMMIYLLPHGAAPQYYCIPSGNAPADLWDKYYTSIKTGSDNPEQRFRFFSLAIAKLMMKMNGDGK